MAGAIEASCSPAPPRTRRHSRRSLGDRRHYFQNGDLELADQALDNADRLDPHAAIVSILRTAFALDDYRADDAMLAAREALRRSRARGGDFAGISVSRQSGSYPVEAYRFINLHDWARFYADRTFDPFQASGYLDQAIVSRPGVFVTQAHALDGRRRRRQFELLQPSGPGSLARSARGFRAGSDATTRCGGRSSMQKSAPA